MNGRACQTTDAHKRCVLQRNRGKRRASNPKGEEEAPTGKQSKAVEDKDSYLDEVRKLERSSLKDKGAGVRALVK